LNIILPTGYELPKRNVINNIQKKCFTVIKIYIIKNSIYLTF